MLTDPIRFRRVAGGLSLIGAGALTWLGVLISPRSGDGEIAAYLSAPIRTQLSAILLHFGYLLLVPGAFAMAQLVRARAVALGHIALCLLVVGGATISGLLVTDFYGLALGRALPLEQAETISDGAFTWGAIVIALPGIIGTALGLLLMLGALWRAGRVPVGVPLAYVAGVIGWAAGGGSLAVAAVSTGVIAVILVGVGARILRLDDAAWQRGGTVAAAPEARAPDAAPATAGG